ncbi:MAG: hypothetical protein IJ155_10875 [Prevotella sp.]|nr:hypothetical protein [Prevotella sp.]
MQAAGSIIINGIIDGEDGKGITSADVVFCIISGTGTPADTADWQTTVTQLSLSDSTKEYYLWQATYITYTDGTHAYTGKVRLGQVKDFAAVTEQYATGTASAADSSTWQDNTPPAPQKGSYLWTRTKLVFANGSISYLPSAAGYCLGYYGEDGKGIVSADVMFCIISGTGTPADIADWQTTVAQLSLSDSTKEYYLWQATYITYTDGTHAYTGKVCLGQVKDFASVTEQYALGTASAATGNWQDDTPPAPQKGSYLWTRTKLVFANGSISYLPSAAGYCLGYYGEDGTSPWLADLDNEMVSVACDAQGKTTEVFDKTVNVKMWHGSQEQSLVVLSTTSHTGMDITTSQSEKTVSIHIDQGTEIAQVTDIIVTIACEGSDDQTLHIYVNGVRPGSNGQPATVFDIVPSLSSIVLDKDKTLKPESQVTCKVLKKVGNAAAVDATSDDGTLRFRKNEDITSPSQGTAWASGGKNVVVSCTASDRYVTFAFFDLNGTLLDKEIVPIIHDGTDGKNAPYDVLSFARSDSRESCSDEHIDTANDYDGWFPTAPEATDGYPYIWERRQHYTWDGSTPVLASTSYTCLTGADGPQGEPQTSYRLEVDTDTVSYEMNHAGVVSFSPEAYTVRVYKIQGNAQSIVADLGAEGLVLRYDAVPVNDTGDSSTGLLSSGSEFLYNGEVQSYVDYVLYKGSVSAANEIGRKRVSSVRQYQRMLLPQGQWDSSDNCQFTRTATTTPLVFLADSNGGGTYWYLDADTNNVGTADNPIWQAPGDNQTVWKLANNFDVVLAKMLFARFASLGSFIVYERYFFSQYGTLVGPTENSDITVNATNVATTYTSGNKSAVPYGWFNPDDPMADTRPASGYKFRPTKCINALTGEEWSASGNVHFKANGDTYIRGEVHATSGEFNGRIIASAFYAPVENIGFSGWGATEQEYVVDMENNPHLFFLADGAYANVTLPNPSSYPGLELQFYHLLGTQASLGSVRFSTRIRSFLNASSVKFWNNAYAMHDTLITLKAFGGFWNLMAGTLYESS